MPPTSTFAQQLAVVRRHIWIVLLTVVMAAVSAVVFSAQQEPVYRASMKIVVGETGGLFQPQFSNAAQPFTQTMTSLLKSNIVARTVIQNLQLSMTPDELLADMGVATTAESSVLEVTFDSTERDRAVPILAEVGETFERLVDERLRRPADATDDAPQITARIFDPPHLERGQVSPRPVRATAVAAALGLALGLVFAFLRESLGDRLRGRRDAEAWFGAAVIGALPPTLTGRPPVALADRPPPRRRELSRAPEILRATVQLSAAEGQATVILVTSAAPDEGKSTVAAHLAVALASAGEDVIVVEADIDHPMLHRYLGIDNGRSSTVPRATDLADIEHSLHEISVMPPGAATWRNEHAPSLLDRVRRAAADGGRPKNHASAPNAYASAPGASAPTPWRSHPDGRLRALLVDDVSTLVETAQPVEDVVSRLRSRARFVIFDGPPIMTMGNTFPLIRAADKVLVAAREGRTRRENAELAREALERFGVRDYFVVLVDASVPRGLHNY